MIKELKIHNFKSLRNVELTNLPPFMVVVGANASGKSNFIKALDFLFHVMVNGLANTIDDFGGYENICYRRERRSKGAIRFSFELEVALTEIRSPIKIEDPSVKIVYNYEFEFQATSRAIDTPYEIIKEALYVFLVEEDGGHTEWFKFSREQDNLAIYSINNDLYSKENIYKFFEPPPQDIFLGPKVQSTELLLVRYPHSDLLRTLYFYFLECGTHFITPDEARKSVGDSASAGVILNRSGSNLASVIKYLKTKEHEIYKNIIEHLRVATPTMESVNSQYTDSKALSYNLKETGVGRPWHPIDVSDGTIQTLCLFIPLEDKRTKIIAYDEPENSIHPWIQKHFVKTCLGSSVEKQIVLATHSIAAVNEVPPESFYIIERKAGETNIRKAEEENPEIKEIVNQKIMKTGEYWESGALGGVPTQLEMEFSGDEKEI